MAIYRFPHQSFELNVKCVFLPNDCSDMANLGDLNLPGSAFAILVEGGNLSIL